MRLDKTLPLIIAVAAIATLPSYGSLPRCNDDECRKEIAGTLLSALYDLERTTPWGEDHPGFKSLYDAYPDDPDFKKIEDFRLNPVRDTIFGCLWGNHTAVGISNYIVWNGSGTVTFSINEVLEESGGNKDYGNYRPEKLMRAVRLWNRDSIINAYDPYLRTNPTLRCAKMIVSDGKVSVADTLRIDPQHGVCHDITIYRRPYSHLKNPAPQEPVPAIGPRPEHSRNHGELAIELPECSFKDTAITGLIKDFIVSTPRMAGYDAGTDFLIVYAVGPGKDVKRPYLSIALVKGSSPESRTSIVSALLGNRMLDYAYCKINGYIFTVATPNPAYFLKTEKGEKIKLEGRPSTHLMLKDIVFKSFEYHRKWESLE